MQLFLSFFLGIFFFTPMVARASISITEIAWMGIAGEGGQFGEWIELYNDGAAQDLSGWKLYSDGGSTLVFSLATSIPAGGYLLIERTTASMSDPVPGVNDESGSFGGGGLSNDGEHLVLKDESGSTVSSLDFSGGWPAGDAASKETMQRSGSSWISAVATPKASSAGASSGNTTDDDGAENGTSSSQKSSVQKKAAPVLGPAMTLSGPSELFQYIEYTFSADVVLADGRHRKSGLTRWNLGDGTTLEQEHLSPVVHRYEYPGTYTIWVDYYKEKNVSNAAPYLSASKSVRVLVPAIELAVIDGSAVELTNQSGRMVDLSQWQVRTPTSFASLPAHTMLSPDASITLSAARLGLPSVKGAVLARPSGELLVSSAPSIRESAVLSSSIERAVASEEAFAEDEPIIVSEAGDDAAPTPAKNRAKLIFGAIAILIMGLFVFFERITARSA